MGAPIGEQRIRALGAARSLLAAGKDIDETTDKVWQGLQACEVGDPDEPWTEEDARRIVKDLASRPPPPLAARPNAHNAAAGLPGGGLSSLFSLSSREYDPRILEVPPFPVNVLPDGPGNYVREGAEALGVPADLITVPLLAFAGAALGNTYQIELKLGYFQRPTLYVATVAPPGFAKSPALDLARVPLDALQKVAYDAYRTKLDEYKQQFQKWKDAKNKTTRGDEPQPPRLAHYFTTDATLEALAPMLGGSPGVAMFRDELVSWVKANDAYRGGRGGDRQQWLTLWSGGPLKIDRKTAEPIYVPRPTVCVVGGIQPDLLIELTDEAGRRDGFVERTLWSYPDTRHAGWSEKTISAGSQKALIEIFKHLRRAPLPDPRDPDSFPTVRLGPPAKKRWVEWYERNARETSQATGLLQGVYAKLPNQLARLTLILHCLAHPARPRASRVTQATMDGAIELIEYFRAHAHRALPKLSADAAPRRVRLASRVLRLLEADDGEWMSRTDLHQGLGRHTATADLDEALGLLEQRGLAERREVPTGGRPSEQWRACVGVA